VVAIGEPTHGAEQPLIQRNRLIRILVEQHGFTTVTLESGLAHGRRIDAWIQGGPGDPEVLARNYLNWGFGDFAANVELMRWLRAHNADPRTRKVHFYGADVSGGDMRDSMAGARLALDDLIGYLANAAPDSSAAIRAVLANFAGRFTPEAYATLPEGDRSRLRATLSEATALLKAEQAAMVARSSADAHDWALRLAGDCQSLQAMFELWPLGAADPIPGWLALSTVRDRAMADYVKWALARDGKGARVVAFAANGHVAADHLLDQQLASRPNLPPAMGKNLRAELGDAYRVIIMSAQHSGDDLPARKAGPGSIELALAAAGASLFLVDIRSAEPRVWWERRQTMSTFRGLSPLIPAKAADAILSLDILSQARKTLPVSSAPR
jgi:erythromycin esterase